MVGTRSPDATSKFDAVVWPPNGNELLGSVVCARCATPATSQRRVLFLKSYGLALCFECLRTLLGMEKTHD